MLLLLFVITANSHLVPFNPERMRLIQVYEHANYINYTNYIFRSNSLLTEDLLNVNFTGIKNTIEYLTNITLSKNFQIHDYSLLNSKIKSDKWEIDVEKKYFNNFYNFPIHGEKFSPYSIKNITKRMNLASTFNIWSRDKLPNFVDMMIENIKSKIPSIQIYHCMQGVDRTGEVIGAYKMKVFKKSLKEIIQEDTIINQGKLAPKIHNLNALEWFELYLKI